MTNASQPERERASGLQNLTAESKERVDEWKKYMAVGVGLVSYTIFYAATRAVTDENSFVPLAMGIFGLTTGIFAGRYWGRVSGILNELAKKKQAATPRCPDRPCLENYSFPH